MPVERIKIQIPLSALRDPKGTTKRVKDKLKAATLIATEALRGELAKVAPTGATGFGANSFVSNVRETPSGLLGTVSGAFYMQLVSSGFGGKGRFPPQDPIALWVKRKGLDRSLTTAPWMKAIVPADIRSKGKKFNATERLLLATIFVRRKIAKTGVKGTNFIGKSVDKIQPVIRRLYANTLKKLKLT